MFTPAASQGEEKKEASSLASNHFSTDFKEESNENKEDFGRKLINEEKCHECTKNQNSSTIFQVQAFIFKTNNFLYKQLHFGVDYDIYEAKNKFNGKTYHVIEFEPLYHIKWKKIIISALELNQKLAICPHFMKYQGFSCYQGLYRYFFDVLPEKRLSDLLDLETRNKGSSNFNESAKLFIISQIAEYMEFIHNLDITHTIMPEAIFVDSSYKISILNFVKGSVWLHDHCKYEAFENNTTLISDQYSFGCLLAKMFDGKMKVSWYNKYLISINPKTPMKIQILIRKCRSLIPEKRPKFTQIIEYLKAPARYTFEEEAEQLLEIMKNPNDKFLNLIKYEPESAKTKELADNLPIIQEYQGKHCLVKFLDNGDRKLVHKIYNNIDCTNINKDLLICNLSFVIGSWIEDGTTHYLMEYVEAKRLCDIHLNNENEKEKLLKQIVSFFEANRKFFRYYRLNPTNIYFDESSTFKFLDFLPLDIFGTADKETSYLSPDFENRKTLENDEKRVVDVYNVGCLIYELFHKEIKVNQATHLIEDPDFEGFTGFWSDLAKICLRKKPIDRPTLRRLLEIMESHKIEEKDIVNLSDFMLRKRNFTFHDIIGAGGESTVFLATNDLTNEQCAIKQFRGVANPQDLIRTAINILLKTNMSSFGIKYSGFMVVIENKTICLNVVMDYQPNGSILDAINLDSQGKCPTWFNEEGKIRIVHEIAEAMKFLHANGIIHKDLKPDNILLDKEYHVKICDFSFIPNDGAGTIQYMAPELFEFNEHTEKTDAYAFGVTIAAIFGSLPNNTIGSKPSISIRTPQFIQTLIRKCWRRKPDQRPSFEEIVDFLNKSDAFEDDLKLKNLDDFIGFNQDQHSGEIIEKSTNTVYRYEIVNCKENLEATEQALRLYINLQTENVTKIHKFYRDKNVFILICIKEDLISLKRYLKHRQEPLSRSKISEFIKNFITTFELFHKNGFFFGQFNLKRVFIRNNNSKIMFDIFNINGLERLNKVDKRFVAPEKEESQAADIYSFAIFVLLIHNSLISKNGKVSHDSLKSKNFPKTYRYISRCLDEDPKKRPQFSWLYHKLYPTEFKIIYNFLSLSVSRFSSFLINKDFAQEDIVIEDSIGKGSYAEVFRVRNVVTNDYMAMKKFFGKAAKETMMVEFAALKTINHPNIVQIKGIDEVNGNYCLFMEFASGGTFQNRFCESFIDFMLNILQISSAMSYLHSRGIIHHDLKPDNILVRENGSVFVTDFNTVLHVEEGTVLSTQRGTKDFMSPEMRRGEHYSFPIDVYAFGLIVAKYFDKEADLKIRKNEKLDFIEDKFLRRLIQFCVDDDPSSRPNFELITRLIYERYFSDRPDLKHLVDQPKCDEDRLNHMRILSDRGNVEAINEFGRYLLLENQIEDATRVYREGASIGCPRSQNTLAFLETNVLEDPRNQMNLIKKSSDKEEKHALANYAMLFLEDTDNEQAALYYEKAFKKENPRAGVLLGKLYEEKKIEGSHEEAISWFRNSAMEGNSYGQVKYGLMLKDSVCEDPYERSYQEYFRLSAYQRNPFGCYFYAQTLDDEEKKNFYFEAARAFGYEDHIEMLNQLTLMWEHHTVFRELASSYYIGSLLGDEMSKVAFSFLQQKSLGFSQDIVH